MDEALVAKIIELFEDDELEIVEDGNWEYSVIGNQNE